MNESEKKKHFGVVYTPKIIVNQMVRMLPTLKNIKICDPACGNGQFLVKIAEKIYRRIQLCSNKESIKSYYSTLENLTGFDIDESALEECQARLNALACENGNTKFQWNLKRNDAINQQSWNKEIGKFDSVIGNPPYVRIQHLETERRMKIEQGNWNMMTGCADLYILFFEMGLKLLKSEGNLIFITPNSWMKTQSGKTLRKCLAENHEINSIMDFANFQVFPNVTTYTAITNVTKNGKNKDEIIGHRCQIYGNSLKKTRININLNDENWTPLTSDESNFVTKLRERRLPLSKIADIHVGIQTQADDIFILDRDNDKIEIEQEILKRVYNASLAINGTRKINQYIIYPYYKDGKLIPERVLKSEFPLAYKYLRKNRNRLLNRDKGSSNTKKWYGYGREVSIISGLGVKILTSGMNRKPNFHLCKDEDSLFYSGYCIKPIEDVSIEKLLEQLNSKDMERYISLISRPYRCGWYSYAKSFIKNFPVCKSVIMNQDLNLE